MKKLTTILLVFFTIATFAQTEGTLTIVTTTSPTGGNYAPRNIVAIWIEDDNGNFVKTLLAYANNRKTHLNTWEASTSAAGSVFNVVDAITGATRNSHGERTCFWDGTDINGDITNDGIYHVGMELTDKNGTGNYSSFMFEKSGNLLTLSPDDEPSFNSISITWEPLINFTGEEMEKLYQIYPNPASSIINIEGDDIKSIKIYSAAGHFLKESRTNKLDVSEISAGTYNVLLQTGKGKVVKKLIIN